MSQHAIINVTTTGAPAWDEIPNIPYQAKALAIHARTNTDVRVRFRDNPAGNYFTIPAGSTLSVNGMFNQGELFVQAAAGTVVEVMAATIITAIGQ